jgi:proline racemase
MGMIRREIKVVDSHTGGEPTRVVIDPGFDFGPEWASVPLSQRVCILRDRHDDLRRVCLAEPRGNEVLVGALLCQPADSACEFGVIFFNNVGYLGMCGHGTIGLVVTLGYLAKISPGTIRIDTPVGPVEAVWHGGAEVSLTNVPSRRLVRDLKLDVPTVGEVVGDVVWSGNNFFLVKKHSEAVMLDNLARLSEVAKRIRHALHQIGHEYVDHVELVGSPSLPNADSKNFVLCPGMAYDRSPCGTGTSAKLACLAADGQLPEGQTWIQEGIVGSVFKSHYKWLDRDSGTIAPTITGAAYITSEAKLIVQPEDPFPIGIDIPQQL